MSHVPRSWSDKFFIHHPFSLYRGWATVLVIITALEAFGVNAQTNHADIWTKIFAFLALFFLDKAAILSTQEWDFMGSYAIRAGLSAIAYHQTPIFLIKCVAFVFAARATSNYGHHFDAQDYMRPESPDEAW